MSGFFYKFITGRGRVKPQLVFVGALVFFAVFLFFLLLAYRDAAKSRKPGSPFITQKAPRPKNLDYKIIKLDTIPFGHLALKEAGSVSQPSRETATQGRSQAPTTKPKPKKKSSARKITPPAPLNRTPLASAGTGSDMIIINHLDQQPGSNALRSYGGLQSVRLKVILPQETPVTNGSLVEARVIKDERFGDIDIPRRSRLLGISRLLNNRVQIEFNEIRIKGVTYTCSGRAYDLKFLPGIPYNPLNAKAKQVLLDELKSAASGIPILGRVVNQPDFNPITDEITTLDEGLEFYVLITNIF